MALITALPTNNSPANSDYLITDNGTTTSKTPLSVLGIAKRISVAISANSSVTLTFGQYTHALVIVSGYSVNIKGMYIATSAVSTMTVGAAYATSSISATASGLNLTITNSIATAGQVFVLILTGSVEQA